MNNPYEMNTPVPAAQMHEDKLTWNVILVRTYNIYLRRFWTFFRIALPAGLLAYLFRLVLRILVRKVSAYFGAEVGYGSTAYWSYLISMTYIQHGTYWIISALLFGAVASAVVKSEYEDSLPLADGYSLVRNRIGAVIGIAILSWTIMFVIGRLLIGTILEVLINKRGIIPSSWAISFALYVPQLIVAGLLSRIALAVPELMDDQKISLFRAIRNSVKKTENWEPFFIVFLIKSAILGYAVYWLAEKGFDQLWNRMTISATVFDWITWAFYICLAAMLEVPLFIAFSLLYCEKTFTKEDSPAAVAG